MRRKTHWGTMRLIGQPGWRRGGAAIEAPSASSDIQNGEEEEEQLSRHMAHSLCSIICVRGTV